MNLTLIKPVIGDEYRLITERQEMVYRGKVYPYVHLCYEEKETGERFTTTDLDEVNIAQVYNQYRAEHGIPFTDEICALRKFYDLPLTTMSKILGFGNNQYGLYESGEVPNLSNGKLLKTVILSPQAFCELADDIGDELNPKVREKIFSRISKMNTDPQGEWLSKRVFGKHIRNRYNGYAKQSLSMIRDCILYYVNRMGSVYKTQMNKLLFYTDFLSYKRNGMGMTGLSYIAIQFGPVPQNWDKIYSSFDDIHLQLVKLSDENIGEKIVSDTIYDKNKFTQKQLEILDKIYSVFSCMSSRQISDYSHAEPAWQNNEREHTPIDYTYAFDLKDL